MKKLLLIMLMVICSLSAKSQTYPSVVTVDVQIPGTLQSFFPNSTSPNYYQTKAVREITVTGNINALDIKFINRNNYFDKLVKVDLSQATIFAYTGTVPHFGTTIKSFGDNVYPCIFTMTTIPYYLESYIIPNSTIEIEPHAFDFQYTGKYSGSDYSPIKEFTIPENVRKIGLAVFVYENWGGNIGDTCVLTTLTSKILDPRLCTTDIYAFEGVNKISCTLHVPHGTSALYRATAPWNQFQTIVEDGVPTDITTHEENKISLYPNPCTNGFTIREDVEGVGNYQLINSSGVVLKNVVGSEYVDVSDLAKGIYFVKGGEKCFKVVKR